LRGIARGVAPVFFAAVQQTALALGRLGITPNMLTGFSLLPALASGLAAAAGAFPAAGLLLLASGACDLLDGPLARASGRTTRYGALLDSTLDRLSDAAPLVGLVAFYAPAGAYAAVPAIALAGGFAIPYVRARAEGLGVTLPRLWMRRADRLLLTVLALLLGVVGIPGAGIEAPLTLALVGVMAVLNLAATASAIRAARGAFDGNRQDVSEQDGA
jgi:CDP-diacylglycerol--glycerol-3-phosphate 3-phosphatidyltransferase